MAKQTERSTYECPATPEELLDEMQDPSGKYKHLQIILTRNSINRSMGLGQQYLVVNNNGFGVYQLLNTDYCNGVIQLKLKDTYTGEIAHITLNITDKHPQLYLICWNDIKQLVYKENIDKTSTTEELLELES